MRKLLLLGVVALFTFASPQKDSNQTKEIVPPKNLDPVYMLDVTKYPKFNAKIILKSGKEVVFSCPKAMFDFYFRPFDYPEYKVKEESDFKKLLVKDYLTGEWIDAKKAYYVFGSRLSGPKGDDLIPLKSKDHVNIYMLKYGGSRVLTFPDIKQRGYALIKYLDMP